MKAIIISFTLLILFVAQIKSQTIPNSGFENWTTDIWDNYNPDNWETSNTDFQPMKITWSYGYVGSWALKATNFGGTTFAFAKCKFPVSNNPVSLNAFVKTEYLSTDSVNIQIALYNNGLIVDNGYWLNTNVSPLSAWTAISIPITQSSVNVDSMEIKINGGVEPGTSLYVDELSFITTGINENVNNGCWFVFPNPANSELNIQNNSAKPFQFALYNSQGEIIIDKVLSGLSNTINLSAYSNGIYFYQFRSNEQPIKSGKIFKQ